MKKRKDEPREVRVLHQRRFTRTGSEKPIDRTAEVEPANEPDPELKKHGDEGKVK